MKPHAPKWAVGGFAAIVLATAGVLATHYEGTRYTAYQDVGGIWTICQGHTRGVQPGDTATDAECLKYLQQDMGGAYAAVQRCITAPLSISQAAAFTDATFNLGPQVVCGSTLQRLANGGDVEGACKQLIRWVHAGGKVLSGLVSRRNAEQELCMRGLP